jgi:hypothetical protein
MSPVLGSTSVRYVLLGLALAGCAGTSATRSDLPSSAATRVPPATTDGSVAGTDHSLDEYFSLRLDEDSEIALTMFRESAIAQCMATAGFRYALPQREQLRAEFRARGSILSSFPLSATRVPEDVGGTFVGTDPNGDIVRSLSPSAREGFFRALNGPQVQDVVIPLPDGTSMGTYEGGCVSDVREKLYGRLDVAVGGEFLALNLGSVALAETRSDQRALAAGAAWSNCMEKHGYSFLNYVTAAEARAAMSADLAAKLEAADRECSVQTGLFRTFETVFAEKLHQQVQADPLLSDFLRRRSDLVKTIIAGG